MISAVIAPSRKPDGVHEEKKQNKRAKGFFFLKKQQQEREEKKLLKCAKRCVFKISSVCEINRKIHLVDLSDAVDII